MENLSLLLQAPLIGSFIFFVLRNNSEWRSFLKEQNVDFTETLNKHTVALDKLSDVMITIDKNISRIQESQLYTAAALDRNTQMLGRQIKVNGKSKRIIDLIYNTENIKGGDIYE